MIAAYIIDATRSSYQIDEIAQEFLGVNIPSEQSILGKGKSQICIKEVEEEIAVKFACMQLESIYKLSDILKNEIKNTSKRNFIMI